LRTLRRLTAVSLTAPLVLLAACSDDKPSATSGHGGSGAGPIVVTASDDSCELSANEASAGTIAFTVTNTGSKVNEFYLYADGDRIMGEVENIGPGLTRELLVEVTEGGAYETACKPGMVGDGIRNAFTVTGSAGGAKDDDAKLLEATGSYQRYVNSQADALLQQTQTFVDLVKANDVEGAKAMYPVARTYWERIEPVAEKFGDFDPKIDGREEVIEDGLEFTGFHRLERDLWQDGLQPDSSAIADRLLADVTEIVALAKDVDLNALDLANGSKALLDEVATGKVTGEEERYSHTDLWDFRANVDGSQAAIASLRPVLEERDPDLVATLDQKFAALDALLDAQREGDGFKLYTDLTEAEVRALSDATDALSAPVSEVAGVVVG
jgi:iron uptake system component EfeO